MSDIVGDANNYTQTMLNAKLADIHNHQPKIKGDGWCCIDCRDINDIYTKTQKLMDEFLNSVSDQEFLDDYLTLERFNGPLVKDFLNQNYFSEGDYWDREQ